MARNRSILYIYKVNNNTYQQLPVKLQFLFASSEEHLGKITTHIGFINLQDSYWTKIIKNKNIHKYNINVFLSSS